MVVDFGFVVVVVVLATLLVATGLRFTVVDFVVEVELRVSALTTGCTCVFSTSVVVVVVDFSVCADATVIPNSVTRVKMIFFIALLDKIYSCTCLFDAE